MEERMSKYAAKQRAKAEGRWTAPVSAPVSVAVSVAVSAPRIAEEAEEATFTDLGKLPEICASHIRAAVVELQKAANVAAEMERLAAPGLQKQEPIGIKGACTATYKRLKVLAKRAAKVVQGEDE